jgi:RimJ/RimL family protein N-acetyltransferase
MVKEEHLEFDNEIIGHFYLIELDSSKPSIGLSVSDSHQRNGLGTLFLVIGIAILQLMGKRELWLTTDLDNEKGYRLYEQFGFRKAGEVEVFLPGDGCMRKELEMRLNLEAFR